MKKAPRMLERKAAVAEGEDHEIVVSPATIGGDSRAHACLCFVRGCLGRINANGPCLVFRAIVSSSPARCRRRLRRRRRRGAPRGSAPRLARSPGAGRRRRRGPRRHGLGHGAAGRAARRALEPLAAAPKLAASASFAGAARRCAGRHACARRARRIRRARAGRRCGSRRLGVAGFARPAAFALPRFRGIGGIGGEHRR